MLVLVGSFAFIALAAEIIGRGLGRFGLPHITGCILAGAVAGHAGAAQLAFIGWFLQNAADAAATNSRVEHVLERLTVRQVMRPEWPEVPGRLPLSRLVEDHMMRGSPRYFFCAAAAMGMEAETVSATCLHTAC